MSYLKNLFKTVGDGYKIALIGLGRENLQFLRWLIEVAGLSSSQILLADQLDYKQLSSETLNIVEKYNFKQNQLFLGKGYLQVLEQNNVKQVFKSPGIWSLKPEFENFRKVNGQSSVQSSLVYFFEKYRDQIIGITGTKGKSTTSSLVTHLINKTSSKTATYCGNSINISPYTYWTQLDQSVNSNHFFVIEISSFQLQDLGKSQISPKYALITNYLIDHLDHHKDLQEYWCSKDNLFLFQKETDFCLVGETVLQKSTRSQLIKDRVLAQETINNFKNLFSSPLLGDHNWSNLAQSLVLVEKITGLMIPTNKNLYQQAISSYQNLPHRLELIRTVKLDNLIINFYDDGYATDPDAVVAAIKSLTQNGQYLWLQLCGKDKGSSVEELFLAILTVQQNLQLFQVDYCGEVGKAVLTTFNNTLGLKPPTEIENFKQTVQTNFVSLKDIKNKFLKWYSQKQKSVNFSEEPNLNKTFVLNIALSPGGSSFDEFDNQQQRSEWWVRQVMNLK